MPSGDHNVYTLPAGRPFLRSLAQGLLDIYGGDNLDLTRVRILLPTRRACRSLRETFLELKDGQAMLLPQMQPVGDVDEEELDIRIAGRDGTSALDDIPPAIAPMQRRILLKNLVMRLPHYQSLGDAEGLRLASALGRFLDQVHTYELDWTSLDNLVPEDVQHHWQITLEFLKILRENWPAILDEYGLIDSADRRNRLLHRLADHWACDPPGMPVIAAGISGAIPAVGRLLGVVANMPGGSVILPGLDTELDDASWDVLDPAHPQYGLKKLLELIGVERGGVPVWPAVRAYAHDGDSGAIDARRQLVREMMRPAATAEQWQERLHSQGSERAWFHKATQGLHLYECDTQRHEAETIAIIMRETLEEPGRTAALVTPDRALARRVATACRRWGIEVDDSAGRRLSDTGLGAYLRACMEAVERNVAPVALLAALKHELAGAGMDREGYARQVRALDGQLRGLKPAPGFEGLRAHAGDGAFIARLEDIFRPLQTLMDKGRAPFDDWLEAHIQTAENLAASDRYSGRERLWTGDAGEAAALFLAELRGYARDMGDVTGADYAAILTALMEEIAVRPSYGAHPRLFILGRLEARLIQCDTLILAGLNEGTWPPDPGHDPWMSRPMRAGFGLPALDETVGMAAHDFTQLVCAPHVIMTRAMREGGSPSVPSRWVQRMKVVLSALDYNVPHFNVLGGKHLALAHELDRAGEQKNAQRPAPQPPVEMRPRELSVTDIEQWLRDPYALYARRILRLDSLEPLEKAPDYAERGTILHEALKNFVRAYPGRDLSGVDADTVMGFIEAELQARPIDSDLLNFWRPRFARIAQWLINHEHDWRQNARPLACEVKGRIEIDGLSLKARADRIDTLDETGAAIIDYKSAGNYSGKGIQTGLTPQLGLEALILQHGGFADIQACQPGYIAYWCLTGGDTPGTTVSPGKDVDLEQLCRHTREGLQALIAAFCDAQTPYLSLPRDGLAPRYNDYEQLARVAEWATAETEGEVA